MSQTKLLKSLKSEKDAQVESRVSQQRQKREKSSLKIVAKVAQQFNLTNYFDRKNQNDQFFDHSGWKSPKKSHFETQNKMG